jgi:hypothetical protein
MDQQTIRVGFGDYKVTVRTDVPEVIATVERGFREMLVPTPGGVLGRVDAYWDGGRYRSEGLGAERSDHVVGAWSRSGRRAPGTPGRRIPRRRPESPAVRLTVGRPDRRLAHVAAKNRTPEACPKTAIDCRPRATRRDGRSPHARLRGRPGVLHLISPGTARMS